MIWFNFSSNLVKEFAWCTWRESTNVGYSFVSSVLNHYVISDVMAKGRQCPFFQILGFRKIVEKFSSKNAKFGTRTRFGKKLVKFWTPIICFVANLHPLIGIPTKICSVFFEKLYFFLPSLLFLTHDAVGREIYVDSTRFLCLFRTLLLCYEQFALISRCT